MQDTHRRSAPTETELTVWRSFLRAHAKITRQLETELLSEQNLSLAAYDVLVLLAEAPERRLRMTELAASVLLSRSGVTRLVDRLEQASLVDRERANGDGRGIVAVLTKAGLDHLRSASDSHLAGVARNFVAILDESELTTFGEICEHLAEPPIIPAARDPLSTN